MEKGLYKTNADISINTFNRLVGIYIEKNWPISSGFDFNSFDHFCKRLALFNEEQQNLILDLTDRFLWVKYENYYRLFLNSFDLFISSLGVEQTKVIICPLLAESDFDKTKSSNALLYLIRADQKAFVSKYKKYYSILLVDTPKSLDFITEHISDGYKLCLIDDFIGSGETVRKGVAYFENHSVNRDSIAIVSLVAMIDAYTQLNNDSYSVFSDCLLEKGLTPLGNNRYIELMKEIETIIKVDDPKYSFGYNQTEALVKMFRTPNNTFPVYWLDNKRKKTAPFPR